MGAPAFNLIPPKLLIPLVIECYNEIIANFLVVSTGMLHNRAPFAFFKDVLQLSLLEYALFWMFRYSHNVPRQTFCVVSIRKVFRPYLRKFLIAWWQRSDELTVRKEGVVHHVVSNNWFAGFSKHLNDLGEAFFFLK